jgi:hypothetical protein
MMLEEYISNNGLILTGGNMRLGSQHRRPGGPTLKHRVDGEQEPP